MMDGRQFIENVTREFSRLKRLADAAAAQVDDEAYFTAPGPQDNSIAVVSKHMAGNMWSRWRDFLTTDGEKPDRRRDQEFVIEEREIRKAIDALWERGWNTLFATLESLEPGDLSKTVTIRAESHAVSQAIHRQLTHYAYHVGQIVYLSRHFAGEHWVSLSLPKGESETFNQNPGKYQS
ncbi:MAG: DUF1572 family protein [Gemmatimonadota bacterium]